MKLQVSSSPHIRDRSETPRMMLDVVIALLPTLAVSIYMFGYRALLITSITVSSAIIFEYISRRVMKRYHSIKDFSAVVTGFLLALNLSPTVPLWLPVIGSFIAIVIVKQMFGGIGQNFVNPALAARVILTLSYPSAMTSWAILGRRASEAGVQQNGAAGSDLISTATPLYILQSGQGETISEMPSYFHLFFGFKGGCLGEVPIAALLIGILYLLIRRVITFWTPLSFIGTLALIAFLGGQDPLYHILSGGLVIGAFFMATDYVTVPLTRSGKVIFGIGCGIITGLIRLYGGMTEGVSFAILFMNLLTPHIERLTRPVPFGGRLHEKG